MVWDSNHGFHLFYFRIKSSVCSISISFTNMTHPNMSRQSKNGVQISSALRMIIGVVTPLIILVSACYYLELYSAIKPYSGVQVLLAKVHYTS